MVEEKDCYQVFSKKIAQGQFPESLESLLAECQTEDSLTDEKENDRAILDFRLKNCRLSGSFSSWEEIIFQSINQAIVNSLIWGMGLKP